MELWSIILFYGVHFFHWTTAEIINCQDLPITLSDGDYGKEANITGTIGILDLCLSHLRIREIFNHDIDALTNIRSLDLSKNYLETFPPVNLNLKSLEYLNLSSNSLTELTSAIWDSKDLRSLDLSINFLKRIPPVNWEMKNLKVLSLANNDYVISRYESPFLQFPNLELLDLSQTHLAEIQGQMFAGIPKTANILIEYNSIEWIRGLFSEVIKQNVSSGLSTMKPENNPSDDISQKSDLILCQTADGIVESVRKVEKDESFDNCHYLPRDPEGPLVFVVEGVSGFKRGWYGKDLPHTSVDLSGNTLPIIDSAVTDSLSHNVSRLDLSLNKIETIEDGVFEKLNLKRLELVDNYLKTIASIGNLPSSLEVLSLEGNSISEIPSDSFDNLINLQKLDMKRNGLKRIGMNTFDHTKNLMVLDFSDNEIDRLESAWFQNLQKLEVINFDENKIRDIPRSLFKMTQLRNLQLSHNNINFIPNDTFPKNLSILGLNSNNIQSIEPGSFTNMTIDWLGLRSNRITEDIFLNNAFHGTVVKRLDLNSNLITNIPEGAFKEISVLNGLFLGSNPLKIIKKGALAGLNSLKRFDFAYTGVTELKNGALFGLPPSGQCEIGTLGVPLRVIQTGVYDDM